MPRLRPVTLRSPSRTSTWAARSSSSASTVDSTVFELVGAVLVGVGERLELGRGAVELGTSLVRGGEGGSRA